MDPLTPEQRSRLMARIRSHDTKPMHYRSFTHPSGILAVPVDPDTLEVDRRDEPKTTQKASERSQGRCVRLFKEMRARDPSHPPACNGLTSLANELKIVRRTEKQQPFMATSLSRTANDRHRPTHLARK